jgi:phosphoribosylamine--glycine ligase
MKILVIGSGGREHALVWKLRQSPRVTEIFCAPGNAGIAEIATLVPHGIHEHAALADFAQANGIGLTVVGPDDALAAGIVDFFQARGLRIFGPTQQAAQFESSKIFAKEFMQRHGIPTAASGHFTSSEAARVFCAGKSYPLVIKADGLALGKGVIIAQSEAEALETIERIMEKREFGEAGRGVVIEEFLTGQECSLHVLVDGKNFLLFPAAQDHKQIFDGDRGPNTGGMGTFSPAKLLTPELRERVIRELMEPFMAGLSKESIAFNGLLFPGLMMTPDGPKTLEFNCRFGDPETQVLLTRLKSDLLDLLEAAVDGTLGECTAEWDERAAVCVVMASGGYPGEYAKGVEITGLDELANTEDVVVFHAGTKRVEGKLVTNGGRVLGVTALGADLQAARDRAYEAVKQIHFVGAQFRTDIAGKGLAD